MTNNANTLSREANEPLEAVLTRAYSGRTITEGYGPFHICVTRRGRRSRVYPFTFDSVEEAAAFLYECIAPESLPPDMEYTICIRLGSAWVQ
jgi:hypothetical protein